MRARSCAFALFFVQNFPSLFLFSAISVSLFSFFFFWSEEEEKGERSRERERKEICVQITQIFYEWTHRGEKGKKLVVRTYTYTIAVFPSFFSFILIRYSYLFLSLLFYLSWYSRILVLQNLLLRLRSFFLSLFFSSLFSSFPFHRYRYINNCDRLAYTGRNMSLNQVPFFYCLSWKTSCCVSCL